MPDLSDLSKSKQIEFVTLVAGSQNFCIEITQIREIRRWAPVTLLPHAPAYVLGVINLRGAVIPIIDLAAKLGFGPITPTARHVIIITALGDRTVGLLVDSVSEILSVQRDDVRDPPELREDETTRCILGIIPMEDDMSRVIDLASVMPPRRSAAA